MLSRAVVPVTEKYIPGAPKPGGGGGGTGAPGIPGGGGGGGGGGAKPCTRGDLGSWLVIAASKLAIFGADLEMTALASSDKHSDWSCNFILSSCSRFISSCNSLSW